MGDPTQDSGSMSMRGRSFVERFDLTGRTALVTGSTRGIGRAIAQGLADAGAAVVVHGTSPSGHAGAIASAMGDGHIVYGDLADRETPEAIANEVERTISPIDILVLNASVQHRRSWDESDSSAFEQQIAVNLHSSLSLIQHIAPSMCRRGWGRILIIGSVQQYRPHPEMLIYAALKSAMENVTRNLARQLAGHGVTVNNLSPGVILTDRNRSVLENTEYRQQVLDSIPSHRFGDADDCVAAACLLCSDAGRYITGTDLPVDGGLRLP